jgi:predicted CxxxxCH...CXXCH cytochrome family protein
VIRHGTTVCAALLLLLVACSKERERDAPVECVSFQDEIGSLFQERCVECHGGDDPAGRYALERYGDVLGPGSDDVSNAIAGDATSRLVTVLDPERADATHAPHADRFEDVRLWVVDCELAYSGSPIHEPGIMDPRSGDFHGRLLADNRWDFSLCTRCHGDAFEGGPAEAPCTTCHAEGPTACETCHRPDLRDVGAHGAHLPPGPGPLAFDACNACHVVPDSHDAPGHIFADDGSVQPPPADVAFGPLAHQTLNPGDRAGPPTYEAETGTCQNVYCHGAVLGDTNATVTAPAWFEVGTGQADCGACHGLPPASHLAVQGQCELCHQRVAGPDLSVAVPALHVDGVVQVGHADRGCASCHGSQGDPAPPVDLTGGTSTDLVTVGAHRNHVRGTSRLRGPIPCADCHLEPSALDDPGHVDSPWPAEVFPGGDGFDGLAGARGATPAWNRETARCADVYCHGGGALAADAALGINRTPEWTRLRQGEASCGSCHGIPPQDGTHDPTWGLTDCHQCHGASVDEFGNIRMTGPAGARTSTHINGVVDGS